MADSFTRIYGACNVDMMATIVRDPVTGLIVHVNPVEYEVSKEYFKVFSGDGYRTSSKMARISFWKPEYITEYDYYGKEPWVLSDRDKEALVRILKAKSDTVSIDRRARYTNWQKAIVEFNNGISFYGEDTEANLLGTDSYNNEFLPFNLPMPNYLEL